MYSNVKILTIPKNPCCVLCTCTPRSLITTHPSLYLPLSPPLPHPLPLPAPPPGSQSIQWLLCRLQTPLPPRWPNGFSYQVAIITSHCIGCTNSSLGIDSQQLRWGKDDEFANSAPQAPVEQTIEEDKLAEAEDPPSNLLASTPRNTKRNSYHRLSRLSDEARLSISSFSPIPDRKGTDSNRSSTTIKGSQVNGTGALNDVDFEKALRKFASERDSFLADLTLSAGAVMPSRPKPRPKTQRIIGEDNAVLKSGVGSLRRRMSFRDMSSMKRQSTVGRQCEFLSEPTDVLTRIGSREELQI